MGEQVEDYLKDVSIPWEEYHKMQRQAQEQAEATRRLFSDTLKTWDVFTKSLNAMQSEAYASEPLNETAPQKNKEPSHFTEEEQIEEVEVVQDQLSPPAGSLAGLVETMGQTNVFKQVVKSGEKPQSLQAFNSLLGALNRNKKRGSR